jgi:two-component system, OmpR family, response regulator
VRSLGAPARQADRRLRRVPPRMEPVMSETKESWGDKRIFTTGEAAEICKVSQQTIIRCFDSGRLTGFRVPGSKFRRIPREELIRFMRANNIPLDALEGSTRRILVVDDDQAILDLFQDVLTRDGRFEVKTCSTGYDAGMLTESFRPHLIILDYMLPDINGNIVCQRIRTNPMLKDTRIIFVSGVVNQDEVKGLMAAGADEFVKKPFNIQALIDRMAQLLGLEASSAAAG